MDVHQYLIATRLTTAEILLILEKMHKIGYYSMEVWGGAIGVSAVSMAARVIKRKGESF